ncbi:MAG: TetR/AcrR family transcriptional regulator [Acidimicrobiales bacterium]
MPESPNRVVEVNGRKRRPWALQSREKLLKAAADEIAEVGFDKARLVDIARRAGMTAGSVYTWFENKEDLFRAVLEDALEAQILGNSVALADVKEIETSSWLLEIARLVPRNYENPGPTPAQKLLIESYYASWRNGGAAEKLMPRLQQHVDLYMSIIDRAKERGDVRTDIDSYALAMVLAAIPLGLSLMNLAGIPRVDDAAMLPLFEGIRRAAKPGA